MEKERRMKMNSFSIGCEHALGGDMFDNPYPGLFLDEAVGRKRFDGFEYGYHVFGSDDYVSFVVHPHFGLENPEVWLYMRNDQGPETSELLKNLISKVLGVQPFLTEIREYFGPCELMNGHTVRLCLWLGDPASALEFGQLLAEAKRQLGTNDTCQILYRDESISDDTI
jgi:hypothetical protein